MKLNDFQSGCALIAVIVFSLFKFLEVWTSGPPSPPSPPERVMYIPMDKKDAAAEHMLKVFRLGDGGFSYRTKIATQAALEIYGVYERERSEQPRYLD